MSYLIVLSPRHKTNNKNQCYDQLTVVNRASTDQCHMTVTQAQVYNSLRCSVFFLKFTADLLWYSSDRRLRKLCIRK